MIEFIDGEDYCRWNGILMSPENHKDLFGIENEIEVLNEDFTIIIYDDWIYSDESFGKTVLSLGWKLHESELRDTNNSYIERMLLTKILIDEDSVSGLKGIKPIEDFFIDYKNFDIEKYKEFYTELDKYYEDL